MHDDGALLDAHLVEVWTLVAGLVADRGAVQDVVVGTFRAVGAAGPGNDPASQLGAVARTLARRAGRAPLVTQLGGPREEPDPPTAGELAAVRRRVVAAEDADAPVLPRPRRRCTVLAGAVVAAVAVLVLALLARPDGPTPETTAMTAAREAAAAARQADVELAARAGIPASGDLLVDQHLARCVDAVRSRGALRFYPDPSTWRVDRVEASAGGVTTSVNGAFFCATSPAAVWVSGTSGVTAGAVQLVRVGPRQLGVLNPDRAAVSISPLRPGALGSDPASTEPTQLVLLEQTLRGPDVAPWGLELRVVPAGGAGAGSYDGPLPDLARTAVRLEAPDRSGPSRTTAAGARLGRCLASDFGVTTADPAAWSAVATERLADGTQVVAARAPGMAAVCAERDGRQLLLSFPVEDPAPAGTLRPVASVGAVGGDPRAYVLLVVDPRADRVVVEGTRQPVTCVAAGGVAVCTTSTTGPGPGTATALDAGGTVVAGPVAVP